MKRTNAQDARIEAVVGDDEESSFDDCAEKFYSHLKSSLSLPCDVTGTEDFRWEEPYVMGARDPKEYETLRRTQPSFRDIFELLAIGADVNSEWMLYPGDDLAAHVRRKSDGRKFQLGLAEIEATDKKSMNHRLLDDYTVWFVDNR